MLPNARRGSASAPAHSAGSPDATLDEPHADAASLGFWQRPFIQNFLPFLTSLLMHAGLVILGLAFTRGVQTVIEVLHKEEVIVPDNIFVGNPDGDNRPPGLGQDPSRPAMQDQVLDVPTDSKGWNDKLKTKDMAAALGAAGGATDPAADNLIGVSPGGANIAARGSGAVKSGLAGPENAGPLAPYGVPGGGAGGTGPRVNFINLTANARRVVFICDGSGSMIPKWDLLTIELQKAVRRLGPPQSYNILFFLKSAAGDVVALSDRDLLFASPENLRKGCEFVDRTRPEGDTDPTSALKMAFAQIPQLIFLLTDGDFQDNNLVINTIRKLNAAKMVKINTLAFMDRGEQYEKVLKQIATENGGVYRFVARNEVGN